MKKIIIAIIVLTTVATTFMAYRFLQEEAELAKDPIEAVPLDAAIIIESSNLKKSWFRIAETNLVYSSLLEIDEVRSFNRHVKSADSVLREIEDQISIFEDKSSVVSLHSLNGGVQFFIATSLEKSIFEKLNEHLSNQFNGSVKHIKNSDVTLLNIGDEDYFLAYDSPFILFASDANLIQSSIQSRIENRSVIQDETFGRLRNSTSSNLGVTVYINGPRTGSLLSNCLKKDIIELWAQGKVLPEWISLDLNEKSNTIILNGLSEANADNIWFTNIKNQDAQNTKALVLLPTDLLNLKRLSISNPEGFLAEFEPYKLENIAEECDCEPKSVLANWITGEVISIQFGNEKEFDNAYFIGCEGTPNMVGVLSSFGLKDSMYKQVYGADLYQFENKDFLTLLGIQDTSKQNLYFARMNDFAVISSYKGISKLAYQYKASQSSIPNNRFINFAQQLMANYSTVDVYYSWNSIFEESESIFKDEYLPKLTSIKAAVTDLNGLIWQGSITQDSFVYHSIAVNTNHANEQKGAVQELWSFNLQHNVSRKPQVVKNHQTGTNEIAIQDDANNLIILSATGKHKWTKPIMEPIMGEIKQIDVYQNGKYQMLFSTATKIHLLDINGNEVTGFPIKLPAQATNEVVVFDYANDGNYRFMINTIDKKLLNYSKEGKPVEGWIPSQSENIVINPVERFVINGLDYIVTNDIGGKVYLYSRKGEPRNDINLSISTAQKDNIYLQIGTALNTTKFIYKDSLERIVEAPIEGNVTALILDSSMHHFFHIVTDLENDKLPDIITSFGNKLSVFGPDKNLFFSEIFDFDINANFGVVGSGNKYTFVSDEKSQKVHLFTHQFKPVQDFPQKGSSKSCLGDLNKDGNAEFITVANGTEIICYSIDMLFGI